MLIVGYAIRYTIVCIIYVVPLVIWSSLCRGRCTIIFLRVVKHYVTNVHIPDPILLVNMLSIAGRLATLK